MKRKLSALALAAALGLSLTACSGGTASSPAPAGSGAPEGTPAQSADSDWSYVEGNGKLKIGAHVADEIGRFLTGGALVSEITQAMLATIA